MRIGREILVRALFAFRDDLALFRDRLNAINTLPVPDRDTGDNMFATVEGLLQESDVTTLTHKQRIIDPSINATFGNSGMLIGAWLDGAERAVRTPAPIGLMATEAAVEVSKTIVDVIPGLFLDYAEATAKRLSIFDANVVNQSVPILAEDLRILLVDTASRAPALHQLTDSGSVGLYLLLRRLLGLSLDAADNNLFENIEPNLREDGRKNNDSVEYMISVRGATRPELTDVLRLLNMDSIMLGQTYYGAIRVHCHGSRQVWQGLQDALAKLWSVDEFVVREIHDRTEK